ncbi:MAG: hypothetical protein CMJ33_02460 [Phycisphaerae bacterium]|nr:hypothetical protein [Phycisphaerae bacterium]
MSKTTVLLMTMATALVMPLLSAQATASSSTAAQNAPDYPPFADVSKGFTQVKSTEDGERPLYHLWINNKTQQVLAELPRDYAKRNIFLGWTVSSGISQSAVQNGLLYAKWKKFGKRIALVEPNLAVRTTGDRESRSASARVNTDRVVLDVPIIAMGPNGGPVINATNLFVRGASNFFGSTTSGAKTNLAVIKKAKAFPENTELAFEMPDRRGRFITLAYSMRDLPKSSGYRPRAADQRVGYFTTSFQDVGDASADSPWNRLINRWHVEKADKSLELSPPKEPIVFYLESKIPVRYRRWVREGVLEWNKAFENIGIFNAIEVYQQDAVTGMHMKKDPEDARYNFIVWTNSNMGFAIGPSRVHPETGQILDADIVMDEGFVNSWVKTWERQLPEQAMEGFSPDTLAWLETRPHLDPRVLLSAPAERETTARSLLRDAAERRARGIAPTPAVLQNPTTLVAGDGDVEHEVERISPVCTNRATKSMSIALMKTSPKILSEAFGRDASEGQQLDGVPEWYIGPLLRDVIMHEVGHTLGLRHNFKASGIYDLSEMNSEGMAGKPIAGSVMDYLPVNINVGAGEAQGPFAMETLGPYDYWAIEFGYGFGDPSEVASRCADPMLAYATDEDSYGADPMARRFDNGKNPLDYAENQIRLIKMLREDLLDRMVEDGDGWAKARNGYMMLLNLQMSSSSIAANWVGGSTLNRDRRGDPGEREPIVPIDADQQRAALAFVLDNMMHDENYGLTPELLRKMPVDKWYDEGGMRALTSSGVFTIHDRIGGMQKSALLMVTNPGTINSVYDNELRDSDLDDLLTVAEVMNTVRSSIWSELNEDVEGSYTASKPYISSLRRDLQRAHMERLLQMAAPDNGFGASSNTVSSLARMQLSGLHDDIGTMLDRRSRLDDYSVAHLSNMHEIIGRAMDSQYIYNASDMASGGGGGMLLFGLETDSSN